MTSGSPRSPALASDGAGAVTLERTVRTRLVSLGSYRCTADGHGFGP